jgi:hypothetical protein
MVEMVYQAVMALVATQVLTERMVEVGLVAPMIMSLDK